MVSQQGQDLGEGDEAQEWTGPILAFLGEKITVSKAAANPQLVKLMPPKQRLLPSSGRGGFELQYF